MGHRCFVFRLVYYRFPSFPSIPQGSKEESTSQFSRRYHLHNGRPGYINYTLAPFPFSFCILSFPQDSEEFSAARRNYCYELDTQWALALVVCFCFALVLVSPIVAIFEGGPEKDSTSQAHTTVRICFLFCTQHGVGVSHSRAMEFGRIRLLRTYTPVCVWSCVLFCFRVSIRVCLTWQISCFGGNTRWHGWPWMDCVLGFAFYSFCVEKV